MMQPEILAPAGSMEALVAALRCGADAVYVGGTLYSARRSAANFDLPQLSEAVRLCHLYGAKLYLAVNTLLSDKELPSFADYICKVAECGVDACIVQDLGVLRLIRSIVPDMPLHASTQMSVHSPEGALAAKELGCCRVVAAREMHAQDLTKLCDLPLEIEVFVHGALCMSVSGQCSFSALVGGRSANRGRCAQACRLPWKTPGGRNPAALSLKDLTLVQHVQKLREMGVTSFKIEGRMKRPEYVAAAVTALRMALAGQRPDMETLQAVFARSGFTDGYFTGRRKDMFGYRRKEDVVAAQNVLQELQNTYRKPRKCSEVSFSLTLRKDTPATLTAWDETGAAVKVTGEIPVPAQKTPLDTALLQKHLQKLGDTIYTCGSVTLENAEALTIPASQCNALRRDAVEALYEERIRMRCMQYTIHRDAFPVKTSQREITNKPQLRLHVRTKEQLAMALDSGKIVCVPLELAESCTPSVSIYLEAPRIIADEAAYCKKLESLRALGFSQLLCHNLADIRIGARLGFTLHGGYGLNLTNSLTAQTLGELGLTDVTGSYELSASQLAGLGDTLPVGGFLYGRLPMMLLRLCPIKAQEGCKKNGCYMTDRTGQRFPLVCSGDYTELCNAKLLWLADKTEKFRKLSFWDLYFTDETPAELSDVLDAYQNGTARIPDDRTNGLYFKGGLA